MIYVLSSYGFGSNNLYNYTGILPQNIQLALYNYEYYVKNKKQIFDTINKNNINVPIAHMPMDILKFPFDAIIDMIKELRDMVGAYQFIIHPNKLIKEFLINFSRQKLEVGLCVENFPWRKKKALRNILQIIEYKLFMTNGGCSGDNIHICLDTSHSEAIWFEYQLMSFILPYVTVIHLSNRKGKKSHLPFNTKGDLNLIGFVKELKKRYNWHGTIVLEYMPEYNHKLIPNMKYLEGLLYGKSQ